mmetsp:Transcript_33852/g.75077  ORF Transcript_33852/g.75077 Transcript_33852/m.75077 type:complete len:94 (-) Transcript_33852:219-500(-)
MPAYAWQHESAVHSRKMDEMAVCAGAGQYVQEQAKDSTAWSLPTMFYGACHVLCVLVFDVCCCCNLSPMSCAYVDCCVCYKSSGVHVHGCLLC